MTHDDIDLTDSKVLVVDDTPANMDVLRGILEEQGYRIFAAPSGEVALKIAPRTLPDIILLDIMMPGIDGLETCRRLKKDPITKDIPVIFVSAKTGIQDIIDGFKVGAVDYINKPIRREEVLVRVHTHLEIVALFRAQEKLTQELAQKNTKIIDTQHQLVQAEKMVSLGTLTAGVAHEINNPNNFLNVASQNLRVDLTHLHQFIVDLAGENADEAVLEAFRAEFEPMFNHITAITEGSTRIKTIVEDLRAFTQLDSSCHKTVNMTQCLQSTINLVRTKYSNVAEFITHFEENVSLLCYPAQLNQVLINLIVNACDAIKYKQQQKVGEKAPEIKLGKVTIGCRWHEDQIEITVQDDGCGMNAQTRDKIFEPFFTTKEVGAGTGLGLSISYGVVQQHGGELTVASELNVGSCLTLTLPRSGSVDGFGEGLE